MTTRLSRDSSPVRGDVCRPSIVGVLVWCVLVFGVLLGRGVCVGVCFFFFVQIEFCFCFLSLSSCLTVCVCVYGPVAFLVQVSLCICILSLQFTPCPYAM